MRPLPEPFPPGAKIDYDNPGIRLYGMRLYKDQSLPEYAAEFMLVLFSKKRVGDREINGFLPDLETLKSWPADKSLDYIAPMQLTLKLLAFFSKTDIDKRHAVHEAKYRELINNLKKKIKVANGRENQVVESLEELFAGFLGAGGDRNWCARTFFPLAECLLSQEMIWNETASKRAEKKMKLTWEETLKRDNFSTFYGTARHIFLARGGEELYLQLCNLFSRPDGEVDQWAKKAGVREEYQDLRSLYESLNKNLGVFRGQELQGLEKLANFIEELDEETLRKLKVIADQRRLSCEWCPRETWPETLLFAIELNNLLSANIDPVERIEQFITACAMQVLRALCAQSIRYFSDIEGEGSRAKAPLGYTWLMSPLQPEKSLRIVAANNLERMLFVIFRALRHPQLIEWEREACKRKERERGLYREADTSYGHGLFLSLGKRMRLIIPRKGPNARMVLNNRLVRYLVVSLLRPGERVEYNDFLKRMYAHYGMAVEGEELLEAIAWSGHPRPSVLPFRQSWLLELLRKGGFLIDLSDACSIVENPFI